MQSGNSNEVAVMSYVQSVLQPGETVRFHTNVHWIKYVPGLALFLAAAVVYLLFARPGSGSMIWTILTLLVAAVGAGLMFLTWFERWNTEIAVTDKRIIYKQGFISRDTLEMSLSKVESVLVDQTILGRIFGYGDITLRGTGGGAEPLRTIAHALEFRSHVTAE
jgi:uncharacterized membrane protein YdbT with pleckstrin-like domain